MPTLYQNGKRVNGGSNNAKDINYDNKASELTAKTVQAAIDEMDGKVDTVQERVATIAYTNPNLLDNPWFTVNQRETKSSGDYYGFDRFRGTYTIKDDLPSFETSQYIIQKLEPNLKNELNNKTLTLSVMLSDGTIYSGCTVYNKSVWTSFLRDENIIFLQTDASGNLAITAKNSITIKAVKLELGTVSTLALDTAPNYQQELAKCQRYFQRLYKGVENTPVGSAFVRNATTLVQILHLPVAMAKQPTITVSGDVKALGSKDITNLTPIIDGSIGSSNEKDKTIIRLNYTITGGTVGQSFLLATGPNGFTLELSADL